MFVDFSLPWDRIVLSKEDEEITNFSSLAKKIRKMYLVSTKIVLFKVGCLGMVTGRLEDF